MLFENRDKIVSKVETAEKGTVVTRTSTDAKLVAALQGHATEVTELVQDGMVAMRRGMMTRMVMGPRGPGAGMAPALALATARLRCPITRTDRQRGVAHRLGRREFCIALLRSTRLQPGDARP